MLVSSESYVLFFFVQPVA